MRKYSHISVHVPQNVLDLFLARVSELAASRWRRDPAAEESSSEMVPGMGVSYIFYVRTDGPKTDIVFLYKDDQLMLNNIFTTGKGITHAVHGRISAEFWNTAMKQACQEMGLNGKHTPVRDEKPEEGLPAGVAHALKFFGVCANKSTGSSDPSDMESWCKFLALVHVTGTDMEEARLEAYLLENKFPRAIVRELLSQYELALALLPLYDEIRQGREVPRVH